MRQRHVLVGLMLMLAGAVCAAPAAASVTVVAVAGQVDTLPDRGQEWAALGANATLGVLDSVRTGSSSWARLLFPDGSVVVVGASTFVRVEEASFDAGRVRVLLRLLMGELRAVVSSGIPGQGRFEVETPTAVADVRGTEFIVRFDTEKAETNVIAIDGRVEVSGLLGVLGKPVIVGAGAHTTVRKGAFPSAPTALPTAALAEARARLNPAVSPDDTLIATYSAGPLPEPPSGAVVPVAAGEAGPTRIRRRGSRYGDLMDQSIQEYTLVPPGQLPRGDLSVVLSGQR